MRHLDRRGYTVGRSRFRVMWCNTPREPQKLVFRTTPLVVNTLSRV